MDDHDRPTPLGPAALQGGATHHLRVAAEAASSAARRRIIIPATTTTLSELRRIDERTLVATHGGAWAIRIRLKLSKRVREATAGQLPLFIDAKSSRDLYKTSVY